MILDISPLDSLISWEEQRAALPWIMDGDNGWDEASPLDLRTRIKVDSDTSCRTEVGYYKKTVKQSPTQLEDGKDTVGHPSWARLPEDKYSPMAGSPNLHRPCGYSLTSLDYRDMGARNLQHHLAQGGLQCTGIIDMHPRMAPSLNGRGNSPHNMGIPDEKPDIWKSVERSVCPVPAGSSTVSQHICDHAGFQSPKTLSPLGVPREGLSPNQEPAGSHRDFGGREMDTLPGLSSGEKSQNSLPLRKRRYVVKAIEPMPQPRDKVPKVEECGRPKGTMEVKKEPEEEECTLYCQQQPEALTNGCTHLERCSSYLLECTRPTAYFPGAASSYLPRQLPVYPFPSRAMVQGPMFGIHPTPCQVICPLESQLSNDIALASRQDEDGDTALHIAVVQGVRPAIQRLIYLFQQGKKSLDTFNNLRQTPLHLAVITKQPDVVRMLVFNGASPMALDRNGQTSIHLACEHSSLPCLQELMDQPEEAVNLETRNYEGLTPLHVAVAALSTDIVLFLLSQRADIDAMDIKSGRSPLTHAAENNSLDMVSLLIKNGANVNSQTYSGNTALHSASGRGLLDIVRLLVKNGADSSIKNYHNDTSLMVASNKKVTDILRGKASRSLPHQCSTAKGTTETVKELHSPRSGCAHSPSSQQKYTDSICRSPGSRRSPVTSHSVSAASPSRLPRSASTHSSNFKPLQVQSLSPAMESQKQSEKQDRMAPTGLACSQFPKANGDYCQRQRVACSVQYPPHALHSEGSLYAMTTGHTNVGITAQGHPVGFSEDPYPLVSLANGVMETTPPTRCSPITTTAGATFPHSEDLPSQAVTLPSTAFPSPTVSMRVWNSTTNGNHYEVVQNSGLDISKVRSRATSPLLPVIQGQPRTMESGQSVHHAVTGPKVR